MSGVRLTEEQKQTLIKYIENDNLENLKQYLQHYNIQKIDEDDLDELIFQAITKRSSIEMIKFLEKEVEEETVCLSLGFAITCHRYDVADFLIEKINSPVTVKEYLNGNFLQEVITLNKTNSEMLLYMKAKGFREGNISSGLIINLINEFNQENLELLFETFVYDTNFIIGLLGYYTHKLPLSHKELEGLLTQEKNKIIVTEDMYKQAEKKDNCIAMKTLFEHDGSSAGILSERIRLYHLLEKAIKINDYSFTENVLKRIPFGFRNKNFSEVLSSICDTNNIQILDLVIDKVFQTLAQEKKEYYSLNITTPPTLKKEKGNEKGNEKGKEKENETVINKKRKYDPVYMNVILNILLSKNNISFLKYVIESPKYKSEININQKDVHGYYPMMSVIDINDLHLLTYFKGIGADLQIKNCNGITLLARAVQKKKYNSIEFLLRESITDTPSLLREKDQSYYIMKAIKQKDLRCIKLFIENAVKRHHHHNNGDDDDENSDGKNEIVIQDINGSTPLILSYKLNHMEIFRYLLKYFDINQKDANGHCLLYYAMINRDTKTANILQNIGADINATDTLGNSILNKLLYRNEIEAILSLLSNDNLVLNEPNCLGETPLIIAVKYYPTLDKYDSEENKQIIQNLIDKGSDINYTDHSGKSALFHAVDNDLLDIVKLLIENGADVNMKLEKRKQMSLLMYTIEKYISNYNDPNDKNIPDMIKYLIDNNALINDRDIEGNTPLIYALKNRDSRTAHYLINGGADITNVNEKGESVLDIVNGINDFRHYNFDNIYGFGNSNCNNDNYNYYQKRIRDSGSNIAQRINHLLSK